VSVVRGRPTLRLGVALALALVASSAATQPRRQDPTWPCQQPLVPSLAAATVWSGPPIEGIGDWRAEPRVAALVQQIAPRAVDAATGEKAIAAFTEALAPAERRRLVPMAFAALLEETNQQRAYLIARIKDLAERQRKLVEIIGKLTSELEAIPASATGEQAAQRAELEERRGFTTRSFDGVQRTMRYACEAPVTLDARLGAYARALEAALS
jgi:hypothetical protein